MELTNRAKIAAYFTVGSYSLLMLIFNIQAPTLLARIAGVVPLIVIVLFAMYDNFLWHLGPLLRLGNVPYIRGTWRGTLTSYRRDENDQKVDDQRDIVVVIRQTYTSLSITLLSAESKSYSGSAVIRARQSEDFVLQYQYQNEPHMSVRTRSPIHSGGSTISIPRLRPTTIEGEYWTARDSRGTMQLNLVTSRTLAATFDEGMGLGSGGTKP